MVEAYLRGILLRFGGIVSWAWQRLSFQAIMRCSTVTSTVQQVRVLLRRGAYSAEELTFLMISSVVRSYTSLVVHSLPKTLSSVYARSLELP